MNIPTWANNPNQEYEVARKKKEEMRNFKAQLTHITLKIIEGSCVVFTMLLIMSKILEFIETI